MKYAFELGLFSSTGTFPDVVSPQLRSLCTAMSFFTIAIVSSLPSTRRPDVVKWLTESNLFGHQLGSIYLMMRDDGDASEYNRLRIRMLARIPDLSGVFDTPELSTTENIAQWAAAGIPHFKVTLPV